MAGRPGRSIPQPAAPSRKGKGTPGRKPGKPGVLGRVFARPGVIVAGASFAAVMTGIVANALLLQKGHHPSPLFSPAPAEIAAAPSPPAVPVPPPAPRPVVETPAAPAPPETPPSLAEAAAATPAAAPATHGLKKAAIHAAHATPARKPAAAPAHPDLIGQLIGKQMH